MIILNVSLFLPLLLIFVFIIVICVVLSIYIKEHFKNKYELGSRARPDKDFENEMLRREFAEFGPDHIELQEEYDDDEI